LCEYQKNYSVLRFTGGKKTHFLARFQKSRPRKNPALEMVYETVQDNKPNKD
jgi:hypothetical protein